MKCFFFAIYMNFVEYEAIEKTEKSISNLNNGGNMRSNL